MLLYYRKVMKVLAEERQQMILQMLKENKVVKLQEICEKSGCSESSARRDFQLLEEKNLLVRVHGGAKIKYSLSSEPDMTGKATRNTSEKNAIAHAAAKHIQQDDVIYLDAGTSTLAMVQYLEPEQNLTVVTNGAGPRTGKGLTLNIVIRRSSIAAYRKIIPRIYGDIDIREKEAQHLVGTLPVPADNRKTQILSLGIHPPAHAPGTISHIRIVKLLPRPFFREPRRQRLPELIHPPAKLFRVILKNLRLGMIAEPAVLFAQLKQTGALRNLLDEDSAHRLPVKAISGIQPFSAQGVKTQDVVAGTEMDFQGADKRKITPAVGIILKRLRRRGKLFYPVAPHCGQMPGQCRTFVKRVAAETFSDRVSRGLRVRLPALRQPCVRRCYIRRASPQFLLAAPPAYR